MRQIQVRMPIAITPVFGGVQCPHCGATTVIFIQVDVQEPRPAGAPQQDWAMLGGTAFCPNCGKQSPVEEATGFVQIQPPKSEDDQKDERRT